MIIVFLQCVQKVVRTLEMLCVAVKLQAIQFYTVLYCNKEI